MIVAAGELLVDCLQKGTASVRHVGGAPFNVAVGAARCGANVAFVGRVGQDDNGTFLLQNAARYGVELHVTTDKHCPTTVALVTLDDNGERLFAFLREGAADYRLQMADTVLPPQTTIVHMGTLMLNQPEGRAYADQLIQEVRRRRLRLSVDANFRDDLFADKTQRNRVMLPYLMAADILKLGLDELLDLTQCADLASALAALNYNGLLFVTDGGRDSMAVYQGGMVQVAPPQVAKVVDATGAGDAFFGAVLAQLDALYTAATPIDDKALHRVLTVANQWGADATQREGAV